MGCQARKGRMDEVMTNDTLSETEHKASMRVVIWIFDISAAAHYIATCGPVQRRLK
jgi:hypothetical protein